MLGDYLGVKFVEFNEVRPSQSEVFEQLVSFKLLSHHKQRLSPILSTRNNSFFGAVSLAQYLGLLVDNWSGLFECLFNQLNGDRPAFQRVILVLLGNTDHDDALIDSVVKNTLDLLINRLIQENGAVSLFVKNSASAIFEKGDYELSELLHRLGT